MRTTGVTLGLALALAATARADSSGLDGERGVATEELHLRWPAVSPCARFDRVDVGAPTGLWSVVLSGKGTDRDGKDPHGDATRARLELARGDLSATRTGVTGTHAIDLLPDGFDTVAIRHATDGERGMERETLLELSCGQAARVGWTCTARECRPFAIYAIDGAARKLGRMPQATRPAALRTLDRAALARSLIELTRALFEEALAVAAAVPPAPASADLEAVRAALAHAVETPPAWKLEAVSLEESQSRHAHANLSSSTISVRLDRGTAPDNDWQLGVFFTGFDLTSEAEPGARVLRVPGGSLRLILDGKINLVRVEGRLLRQR